MFLNFDYEINVVCGMLFIAIAVILKASVMSYEKNEEPEGKLNDGYK